MFGYNAQFKRCAIDGAKTLRVQRLSATTGVKIGREVSEFIIEHIFNLTNRMLSCVVKRCKVKKIC